MENNEDNPVPSLDNLYKKWLKEEETAVDSGDVLDFIKFCNDQNGVETNKEQPKNYSCPFCGNSLNCDDACMTGKEYDRLMR
jgi:hypothetical protein